MIAANIPLPQGLTFAEWANLVTEQLAQYGVPQHWGEPAWQDWVAALSETNELVAAGMPLPYGFATWDEWATRFVATVR